MLTTVTIEKIVIMDSPTPVIYDICRTAWRKGWQARCWCHSMDTATRPRKRLRYCSNSFSLLSTNLTDDGMFSSCHR